MRGCFVTGTGTGVGKTVVAAAIVAALRRRGERVVAHKPVLTGTDEPRDPGWPPDHEILGAAAGTRPEAVAPLRFGAAAAPHLAAQLADQEIHPARLVATARAAGAEADAVVVEGVGGLLVPLTHDYCVRDLAVQLALPIVLAASPGLGTINHTLLTIEAARAAGLCIAGVVLTPWPSTPTRLEFSNRHTIARVGRTTVTTLPRLRGPYVELLAEAGGRLPLDDWIHGGHVQAQPTSAAATTAAAIAATSSSVVT